MVDKALEVAVGGLFILFITGFSLFILIFPEHTSRVELGELVSSCECEWDKFCQDTCANKWVLTNYSYSYVYSPEDEEITCYCTPLEDVYDGGGQICGGELKECAAVPPQLVLPKGQVLTEAYNNLTNLQRVCKYRGLCNGKLPPIKMGGFPSEVD